MDLIVVSSSVIQFLTAVTCFRQTITRVGWMRAFCEGNISLVGLRQDEVADKAYR